jgi:hypothetical protein
MADQAQRAKILEVALAAAFDHRHNMICVPQRLPRDSFETPLREKPDPVYTARAFQLGIRAVGVDPANRANAPVTQKDLFAKIAGVGPKTPLMYAPV